MSAAFDHHPMIRRFPHGRNNGNGCCQFDGTGIIHGQNCHGLCGVSGEQEHRCRCQQMIRHNTVCQTFRFPLYAGFQFFRSGNEIHNPLNPCLGIDCHDFHSHRTFLHQRSGINHSTFCLSHRQRLSCHGGFVYHGFPFPHFAVNGNHGACADTEPIPRFHIRKGNLHISFRCYQPYFVNLDGKAGRKSCFRPFSGVVLQNIREGQQEHNGRRRGERPLQHGSANSRRVQYIHVHASMKKTLQSMPQKRHCPQTGLADLQRNWQQQFFRHSPQYHTANLLLEPQVNGLYILFPCGFHFRDVCPAQLSYQLQQIFFGNFLAIVNEDTAVLGAGTHPLHANFLP